MPTPPLLLVVAVAATTVVMRLAAPALPRFCLLRPPVSTTSSRSLRGRERRDRVVAASTRVPASPPRCCLLRLRAHDSTNCVVERYRTSAHCYPNSVGR